MLETSVRLLRLLALLQSRPEWSGAELARRLEVSSRTVRNDMERLRILGYQVRSSPGLTGGYRLAAGSVLPPLLLDDQEAVAVAVSLSAAAAGSVTGIEETSLRALTKLEQTLPARLRHTLDTLRSATVSAAGGGGPTVAADTLTTIAAAARQQQRLRFDYRGHDGQVSTRQVEPHRLVYTGRRWYLLAFDPDRGDWRTFRADRLRPRLPFGQHFTARQPPEDAATVVRRGVSARAWPHQVRVLLHAPAPTVSAWLLPDAGLLSVADERSCVLETGGPSRYALASFLASLEVRFTVLDPPEFAVFLREVADRFRHAASGQSAPPAASGQPSSIV